MALKDLEIRSLEAEDRVYKRSDERGLYIEVHPSGSKLRRLKYSHLGKDKRIALGRYPELLPRFATASTPLRNGSERNS